MINAKEARELSQRCKVYCNKLNKHLQAIEFRIKDSTCMGGSVITYDILDTYDPRSLAYDLGRKLREEQYNVKVAHINGGYALEIRW